MMRLKSPLALIAALLAGVVIVSAIIYSTYRSMESEADKVAVQACSLLCFHAERKPSPG